MLNKKDMPKIAFAGKLKKKVKNITPAGLPLGHELEGHRDVFFLTTAHEDVIVEVPLSTSCSVGLQVWFGEIRPDAVTLFI
jgi:hypothetical protein